MMKSMLGGQDINTCGTRNRTKWSCANDSDSQASARLTYLVLALMGIVNFDQALSARLGPIEHELYALTVLTVLLYSVSKRNIDIFLITVLWCIVGLIFSSPEKIYWKWVITDYFIIAMPFIFATTFNKINMALVDTALPWIVIWLTSCAIVSSFFEYDIYRRTEPPDLFLIAAVSYYMSTKKGPIFWATSILYILLVYLTFESQVRAYLVFIIFLPIAVSMFLNWTRFVYFIYIGTSLLLLLQALNFGIQHERLQEIEFMDFTANHFYQGRASEVMDLSNEFRNLANYIFGIGPGAVYIGNELLITTHWVHDQDFRMTSDGHIHLVHFGPAAFYFRFGILGLILYFIIWPGVAIKLLTRARSSKLKDLSFISGIALLLLWLNAAIRPSYVNIDFIVTFAMCITLMKGNKIAKG